MMNIIELIQKNINLTVPWYLMASYAYYVRDENIITDNTFDNLAIHMANNWDIIEHHHKYMITLDDLSAGTLLRRDFPGPVIGAADMLIKQLK